MAASGNAHVHRWRRLLTTVAFVLCAFVAKVALAAEAPRPVAISDERGGTNYTHASAALHVEWTRPGGDYVDAKGVRNGPTPHATAAVARPGEIAIDVSSVEGDLLLRFDGATSPVWSQPKLDGIDARVFWVHSSSNRAIGPPLQMTAFVFNPRRAKRLTLRLDTVYQTGRILVDRVAPPVPPAWPMQAGGLSTGVRTDAELRHDPRVLRYLETSSEKSVRAWLPRGTVADPFAYDPQWLSGPQGLPVLRAASTTTAPRLLSWFLRFEPQEEVYGRYALLIEDDVADGMTELGVKLPGLAGGEVSWRMEHGMVAPGNRGRYAALDYMYAADSGPAYPPLRPMGGVFEAGRWYAIEQYVKLNTPGKADGIAKVWINGHLTWSSERVRFRDKPDTRIDHMHVNLYHGGMGVPKAPIHYRLGAIAIAKSYIGPPPELVREAISR